MARRSARRAPANSPRTLWCNIRIPSIRLKRHCMDADTPVRTATATGQFARALLEAPGAGQPDARTPRAALPCASHPDAPFFAAVLAKSLAWGDLGRTGLAGGALRELLAAVFPHVLQSDDPTAGLMLEQVARQCTGAPPREEHRAFVAQTGALLDAYAAPHGTTPWVSRILIHACLRTDHLWRDLGLAGREDVTALLRRHYPGLPERNVHNLRWKKFLAYAARERAGLPPQAAPGCAGCEEEAQCYPVTTAQPAAPVDVIRTR